MIKIDDYWGVVKQPSQPKLTQDDLIDFFKKRKGWKIMEIGDIDEYYGICIYARYLNRYGITIVAGKNFYCSPKKITNKYHSVEVGFHKNIKDDGKSEWTRKIKNNEPVVGWVDARELVKYIEKLEKADIP